MCIIIVLIIIIIIIMTIVIRNHFGWNLDDRPFALGQRLSCAPL
jgi:hypothetical protein